MSEREPVTMKEVGQVANIALSHLKKFFAPEAKLSFIVTIPGKPECTIYVGDADLHELSDSVLHIAARGKSEPLPEDIFNG